MNLLKRKKTKNFQNECAACNTVSSFILVFGHLVISVTNAIRPIDVSTVCSNCSAHWGNHLIEAPGNKVTKNCSF